MEIWLNFIMKNEVRVLPRMLQSILPLIDGVVCVDTGSTDNSKELVKELCVINHKPCEVYDYAHKPEDEGFLCFDEWRNFALDKLKDKDGIGIWMDCDEEFMMPNGITPENIAKLKQILSKSDNISVQAHYNNTNYSRSNFFRIGLPWKWISCVHEVLTCDKQLRYGNVDDKLAFIKINPDGHSWTSETQQAKYERHAKSLHHYIDKHGMEPRAVFYLSNSYKDQNTDESRAIAIEWYKERVKITTGFHEERYVSQMRIADLMYQLNKPIGEVLLEYMKCSELDDLKADHFTRIMEVLQKEEMWHSSYLFGSYAMRYNKKSPFPNRQLFIDNSIYDHRIANLHRHNCVKLGKIIEIIPHIDIEETYKKAASISSDFSEHMPVLKKYASKCSSLTEIQARWTVCSTYAFFTCKAHSITSYDYYDCEDVRGLEVYAKKAKIPFRSIIGTEITKPVDRTGLLLIDGIHDYDVVLGELKLHSPNVLRYIVLHDTTIFATENSNDKESPRQGLRGAIEEFLASDENWNMIEVLENNHGLTVLERGKWKDQRRIKF